MSTHAFDIYTDAVVHLLADRGVDRLSVRAIAGWMGVTPAAVLQQHSRAQILEVVVARFSWRWLEWSHPPYSSDLPARLPVTEDDCHGVRVWQALNELARGAAAGGDVALRALVETARREEHEQVDGRLARMLHRRAGPHELGSVLALVAGLRAELVAPSATLTSDTAEELLSRYVRDLRSAGG